MNNNTIEKIYNSVINSKSSILEKDENGKVFKIKLNGNDEALKRINGNIDYFHF